MKETKAEIIKLITKYQIRSESRIFKLKKIQREYQLKLNSFNSQGVFKLDFSAFETMEIAKKVIFGSLFSISKSVSSTFNGSVSTSSNLSANVK